MKKHLQWFVLLMVSFVLIPIQNARVLAVPYDFPIDVPSDDVNIHTTTRTFTEDIVIDGVFSGELIDADGQVTPGIGTADMVYPGFIELKKFDTHDKVYYQDANGNERPDAEDHVWVDTVGSVGFFDSGEIVILGSPDIGEGRPIDALKGETSWAYNDAEINDNNAYDVSEDIYLVDNKDEFRGAQQRVVYDPLYPDKVLAHLYITNDADTVFMHNDFVVDTESVWIDGDGTSGTGDGIQQDIGFPVYRNMVSSTLSVNIFGRWFKRSDNVYWYSSDPESDTWFPAGDALWIDNDDNGIYDNDIDRVIIDTGELSNGTVGRELNSDGPAPIYGFVYNDENLNDVWDDGEDISTLDGDETFDWNYFFDQWSWLIDGDGAATTGRGDEDLIRIDGNTWFQASDRVFHYDANGNGDWNSGDALWVDVDGDGVYASAIDTMLVMSGTIHEGLVGKLLWVKFVDGDGPVTEGDGAEYIPRRGQTPFARADNIVWYDAPDSENWFWSAGDGLWIDRNGNSTFNQGVDSIIVRGGIVDGTTGIRLAEGAHHFGYDDGEVVLNGRYDPGEDIYAANTYLAYDDFEVTFNGQYDVGEDIYDRDYIEIWAYAEGETGFVPTGMYVPDKEPYVHDTGFRVHVNGIRVDDPNDDYDAPTGFQAAAGWGPTRASDIFGIAEGTYNRHYEYKLTSGSASTVTHLVSNGQRVDIAQPQAMTAPRVWDSDHKIDWETCQFTWITHWKDLRRGRDNYQGFGSPSGHRKETVLLDWLHPTPPVEPATPHIVKEPLSAAVVVDPMKPFAQNVCWRIFVHNPSNQPLGEINLFDHLPAGWWVENSEVYPPDANVFVEPGDGGAVIGVPDGLAPDAWIEVILCTHGEVSPSAENVTNILEGDVDDDNDPNTDPVSIPQEQATIPIVTQPEVSMFKIADQDEGEPGGRVTWRIGVVNTGRVPLQQVSLEDDVPDELRNLPGTFVLGEDVTRDLGTLYRGQAHILRLETEITTAVQPSTTLTNTLTLLGDMAWLETSVVLPYHDRITATIHITHPSPKLAAPPYGTLCTHSGPPITDFALRLLLDATIPSYHSALLIFTQCYGGDMLDNFVDRDRTGALSATTVGQRAIYGGYDDDAAAALRPGSGRTSETVHQAGVAGKEPREKPQQIGETISLTPAQAAGEIQSRHVLVYAGCPNIGGTWDSDQRDVIQANFAGAANTTVTAVGRDGAGGWDYPGSLAGLRDALMEIGDQMNADEQFVLFITDHGDHHPAERDIVIPARATATAYFDMSGSVARDMFYDSDNDAVTGITLYAPGVVIFAQGDIAISLPPTTTVYTQFNTYRLDIDGDGDFDTLGEGTYLVFSIPESDLLARVSYTARHLEVDIENRTLDRMAFTYVSLDSGPISKRPDHPIYLPSVLKQ